MHDFYDSPVCGLVALSIVGGFCAVLVTPTWDAAMVMLVLGPAGIAYGAYVSGGGKW